MSGLVMWDFDGTLGYRGRDGARLGFSTCLVEVLDAHRSGHGIDRGAFHPFLRTGFPRHPEPGDRCAAPDLWEAAKLIASGVRP